MLHAGRSSLMFTKQLDFDYNEKYIYNCLLVVCSYWLDLICYHYCFLEKDTCKHVLTRSIRRQLFCQPNNIAFLSTSTPCFFPSAGHTKQWILFHPVFASECIGYFCMHSRVFQKIKNCEIKKCKTSFFGDEQYWLKEKGILNFT